LKNPLDKLKKENSLLLDFPLMPLKDGSYKGAHLVTRRAILDMLKLQGCLSAAEIAKELGISSMGVRQQLQELDEQGDVQAEDRSLGKGRPTKFWTLTSVANRHFPDRHNDLMVDLISSAKAAFGDEGLDRLLEERGKRQIAAYREKLDGRKTLQSKVKALSEIRSDEGYLAEVKKGEDGSLFLVENHCPICVAAENCQGLCAVELKVFRKSLGEGAAVERVEHLLSGARRCAYRISASA